MPVDLLDVFLFFFKKRFFFLLLIIFGHCCTGFSLVAASGAPLWLCCTGFTLQLLLLLLSVGSRSTGFSSCPLWALEHRLNNCGARVSLLLSMWDLSRLGSKPCLLHWQPDSYPLNHQGSPSLLILPLHFKFVDIWLYPVTMFFFLDLCITLPYIYVGNIWGWQNDIQV